MFFLLPVIYCLNNASWCMKSKHKTWRACNNQGLLLTPLGSVGSWLGTLAWLDSLTRLVVGWPWLIWAGLVWGDGRGSDLLHMSLILQQANWACSHSNSTGGGQQEESQRPLENLTGNWCTVISIGQTKSHDQTQCQRCGKRNCKNYTVKGMDMGKREGLGPVKPSATSNKLPSSSRCSESFIWTFA